jgi:GntR family transcriptional regulator
MKLFNEDTPLYLQLRKHIEELILERALPEEAVIPSIRVMAKDYSLNPLTIANALGVLVDEGILYKKRGLGMYVSPDARKLIIEARSKDFVAEKLVPVLRKARQLEIPLEQISNTINEIYGGSDE